MNDSLFNPATFETATDAGAGSVDSIATRAMLVRLSTTAWRNVRKDKKATREVNDQHHVKQGKATVRKELIECPEYDALMSAYGSMRLTLYHYSLPWTNEGDRIVLIANYSQLMAELRKIEEEIEYTLKPAFQAAWPAAVKRAETELNGLYDPNDYPSEAAICSKFSHTIDRSPVPTGKDFRVGLSADAVTAIRQGIETRLRDACSAAAATTWERVRETLTKMAESLKATDSKNASGMKTYRDTLFTNVSDLIDVLPGLNILQDPQLDRIAERVRAEIITKFQPDQCRKDLTARAEAAAKVEAILAVMPPPAAAPDLLGMALSA